MADKIYNITFKLSDGSEKTVQFTAPQGEKGDPGNDGISVTAAEINDEGNLILALSNGETIDTGIAKGTDGFTPSIQVVPDDNGWQVNFINDNYETDSIYITNGYSPQVDIESITNGHKVTTTWKDTDGNYHYDSFNVMNGDKGETPAVTVEDIEGGHRVTIGGESFDVMDGKDGGSASGPAHILDGAADGSLRTSGATAESASYKLGKNAFAQGTATKASGQFSHAEGSGTVASNYAAHAEGTGTIAAGEDQHVQGTFNVEDADSKYLHIVGNGTSNTDRSNAHTIDRDGNAWFKGKVFVGGTGQDDADAKELGGASSWNDLTDKPFGEVTETAIIPSTTVQFSDGQGAYSEPLAATPEVGATYFVTWNGVSYECVGYDFGSIMGEDVNGIVCGNLGAMDVPGHVETGEPFIIILFPNGADGSYAAFMDLENTSEITVSVALLEETKLPANLYPAEYAPVVFVNITSAEESINITDDWTTDKTYAEVISAVQNGCMVLFKRVLPSGTVYIMPLGRVMSEGYIVFGCPFYMQLNLMYAWASDGTFQYFSE